MCFDLKMRERRLTSKLLRRRAQGSAETTDGYEPLLPRVLFAFVSARDVAVMARRASGGLWFFSMVAKAVLPEDD